MMVRHLSSVTIALAIVQLLVTITVGEVEISNRYNISHNSNTETVKIGNTKTKNYNIHENNYLPTQLTQVVLNVPKLNKKLRKSRPPTVEEFEIKRKIVDVYDEAKSGSRLHMSHLGRIIQALNPKYIATERVRRVAFADPRDPSRVEAPYAGLGGPLELRLESGSIGDQLDSLNERFRDQVKWTQGFIEELANTSDDVLNSQQSAFKRLILCLSQPALCNLLVNKDNYSVSVTEPDEVETSASASSHSYQMSEPEQYSPQLTRSAVIDEEIPMLGYHRSNSEEAYEPSEYESNYDQQVPPPRRTYNIQSRGMMPEDQMMPAYSGVNTGRATHQKNGVLPKLRNFRFIDQQSKPRILSHLTKQIPRNYQGY